MEDIEPIDNLSAVLYGVEDMRMEQKSVPELENNQVVIRMESVGICGSDIHAYSEGQFGPWNIEKPVTIGHEGTGTVMRTGKDVKHLQLGDRVCIEAIRGCNFCDYCKQGKYHHCPNLAYSAVPPTDGMMSRFFVHNEDLCHKLPDNVDFDEGVFIFQIGVAIHACKKANMTPSGVVLIIGAGPMGLLTALVAKSSGATKILIIDVLEYRLDKAKELGLNYTLQIQTDTPEEDIVNKVQEILDGRPNSVIDCVGSENSISVSLQVVRNGGTIVVIGLSHQQEMIVPIGNILNHESNLKGVFGCSGEFPAAIELVRSGRVNVKPLITHHFQIEDTVLAFKTAKSGEDKPIKIIIHPNEDWIRTCGLKNR